MKMRGASRRETCIDPRSFGWDPALVATLRHSSLPFGEPLPLAPLGDIGRRDRLSLLGQFAAHQALLQFAGLADGDFDAGEWAVVQKRGADIRLVRIGARACDPTDAPPVLTLAQQFAEQIGAELETLAQSWARADAIYADVFARVTKDAAADLRWLRKSACGSIAAPGPEALRALEDGRFGIEGDCAGAIERYAQMDGAFRAVIVRGASPLERYSALPQIKDRMLTPAAAAERMLAMTSQSRHVFVVADAHAFDEGSRQVVEILSRAGHGTWLIPGDANALPGARPFIVAPRIAARASLDLDYEAFVDTPAFASYLAHGDVPKSSAILPLIAEPTRSYLAALALLGTRVPCELAKSFLGDFLFHGDVHELAVDGVTRVDNDVIVFTGDAIREQAAKLAPSSIARVAATHANGIDAALLWLDAGEPQRAAEVLDAAEWTVDDIRRVPRSILTPQAASRYAHMLIDAGRYRDARDIA
ncbi:MAG TPA: hypothetical protein VM733_07955, partial [Thermoanaerobaculia bacterium]|nr:hypothetical protein [Thermoanaerobaculia bacterium]